LRDSYSPKGFASGKRQRRFRATVQAADVVIAGNAYLAEHARQMGARVAAIIPTCVDVRRYPMAQHHCEGAVLVWVGSSSTLNGLELISPVFSEIAEQ